MENDSHHYHCHGLNIQVSSPDKAFLKFIDHNYLVFKDSQKKLIDIKLSFSLHDGERAERIGKKLPYIGADTHFDENLLYWENSFGFKVLMTFHKDQRISIEAYHFDLKNNLTLENSLKNYQRSMRWSLHFPLFFMLKVKKGLDLMHASAISKNGNSLIFAGLNGVGKSSIAQYMVDQQNYKVVTDNFLLIGQGKAYSFPERLRVSKESFEKLKLKKDLSKSDLVYGKHQFNLSPEEVELISTPQKLYIIKANAPLALSSIAPQRMIPILQGIHDLLQEFPAYSPMAMIPLFWKDCPTLQPKFEFPDTCHTSFLSHPMDWDYNSIVNLVSQDVN